MDILIELDRILGTQKTRQGAERRAKTFFKKHNIPFVPFGGGDAKTDLMGFYRKVDDSCPPCPHAETCYGGLGNCYHSQKRASMVVEATINSFYACSVISHKYDQAPSRNCVSGDVARNKQPDEELIEALCEASRRVCEFYGVEKSSYGYTHCGESVALRLSKAGLETLVSDAPVVGGAVVSWFSGIPELRKKYPGPKFVACPAQKSKEMTCKKCRVCEKAREQGLCIVFEPHGALWAKVEIVV